jgi:hypothetical protein
MENPTNPPEIKEMTFDELKADYYYTMLAVAFLSERDRPRATKKIQQLANIREKK